MWATLGRWCATFLLVPLLKWVAISVKDWFLAQQELKKLREMNEKTSNELKEAKTKLAALEALNRLP